MSKVVVVRRRPARRVPTASLPPQPPDAAAVRPRLLLKPKAALQAPPPLPESLRPPRPPLEAILPQVLPLMRAKAPKPQLPPRTVRRMALRKRLVKTLCKAFPKAFSVKRVRPLKVGIRRDIEASGKVQLDIRSLGLALGFWTRGPSYLAALAARDSCRIGLDGRVIEKVSAKDRTIARQRLAERKRK